MKTIWINYRKFEIYHYLFTGKTIIIYTQKQVYTNSLFSIIIKTNRFKFGLEFIYPDSVKYSILKLNNIELINNKQIYDTILNEIVEIGNYRYEIKFKRKNRLKFDPHDEIELKKHMLSRI
jgi:hypothetical protein